jgi:hypothetical protein
MPLRLVELPQTAPHSFCADENQGRLNLMDIPGTLPLRQASNGVYSVWSGPNFISSGTNKAMVYYETQLAVHFSTIQQVERFFIEPSFPSRSGHNQA